jgi:hypothetical protein
MFEPPDTAAAISNSISGGSHAQAPLPSTAPLRLTTRACRRRRHLRQSIFTDRLSNDAPFECTGDNCLKSTALVEACCRSPVTGQVVAVAP